jgi:Ca2+-binding RTX toxin-like protein
VGLIDPLIADYDSEFVDFDGLGTDPVEVIATGDNLRPYWDAMTAEASRIGDAGYSYNFWLQNSNTFVDALLRAAGLPEPEMDDSGESYAPGSGRELSHWYGLGSALLNPLTHFFPGYDPGAGLFGALLEIGLDAAFGAPPASPLVVDLDGDGVELIGLGASETLFDLNVDGFAELTGWVQPDDGFLAFDRNGNGVVDDNTELFGTGAGHANGFLYLAELDTNEDGSIDSADAAFSALSIWRDLDGDGITDDGELLALSSYGIASIDLAATAINETNEGNPVKYRSHVTYADGSMAVVDDVFFNVDSRVAAKLLPENFAFQFEALALPLLPGYGTVASTWVALSVDSGLLTGAKTLTTKLEQGDLAGFLSDFDAFLLAWAGVSDVNPASSGSYVDARHLAFLEAMYGQEFNGGSNPGSAQGAALEAQFSELADKLAVRFMAQAPGSSLALGTIDSIDDHPLAFLLPLATAMTPENLRLQGSIETLVLGAFAAIDAGTVATEDVVSVLKLLRVDLGYSDLPALGADLAAAGMSFDRDDTLALEVAAAVAGKAILVGGDAADTLAAASTATAVDGRGGNDVLDGGSKADWLIGGQGGDTLRGGQGGDTYIYNLGDGNDYIQDYGSSNDVDRLVLGPGIAPEEVTLIRSTSDLDDLTLSFAGGSVLLNEHFDSVYYGVDRIDFADGTSWSRANLRTSWLAMKSTDGNDVIDGFNVADVITGGRGNDTLRGGHGADTYIYNLGDGDDYIHDYDGNDVDRLVLGPGIAPGDVTITRSTSDLDDLTLSFADGGSVFLNEHFDSVYYGVDRIDFADGTSWSRANLRTSCWR